MALPTKVVQGPASELVRLRFGLRRRLVSSHRARGRRQVHHHGPPDLQVRRHRQADHREVREGGGRAGQGLLQVCLGAGQPQGGARARHHHRHRAVEVRDAQVPLHRDRRAGPP
eukprot:scaffold578_cov243-Pinguiococcus_pyrenoidosus.AAC.22